MAFLLTNLLQNIYSDIGQTDPLFGIFNATGGSTTTFVNADWTDLENPPEADSFKNDLCVVVRDAAGASAAPEGEYKRITAYADATWTGTVASAFSGTSAIASGDTIMIAKQSLFPLQQVIFCINRALSNLGDIELIYSGLTTASGQTEYAVPVALKRQRPLMISYPDNTDTDDNDWHIIYDFDFETAAPGSTGLLYLPQLTAGLTLRLRYNGVHPILSAYNDPISETIHPKLVTAAAIIEVLSWYNSRDGNQGANEYFVWLEQEYRTKRLGMAQAEHPIEKTHPVPKWLVA